MSSVRVNIIESVRVGECVLDDGYKVRSVFRSCVSADSVGAC
jgi:hypothetical protein